MGILNKLKDVFMDKSEVEQELEKKVVEPEEIISERDFFKEEKKEPVKKQVMFEEKDIIIQKPVPKKPVIAKKKENKKTFLKEKEKFKPSPVISPVFGVIEENYKDGDPRVVKEFINDPRPANIDEIRKKAYGTLEDSLEDTLSLDQSVLFYNLEEETDDLLDNLYEEKNTMDLSKTLGEMEEVTEEIFVEQEEDKEEHDLFDMLDSIYGEEE